MPDQFISEDIEPRPGTFDTARMAIGEPGLPGTFQWRGKTYTVREVVRQWKDTGPCTHKSGEEYRRKFWYEVIVTTGTKSGEAPAKRSEQVRMKIYFQKPGPGAARTAGWRLYSMLKE